MVRLVVPNERALADRGYRDREYFIIPSDCRSEYASHVHKAVMARHETVNHRLKSFEVLKQVFRHDISKHILCFSAVVNLVEIMIENGHPLYRPSCL
jgi:hypothetical protein